MVCRCDLWVWLFGRDTYFAHCANVKICPASAPGFASVEDCFMNFLTEVTEIAQLCNGKEHFLAIELHRSDSF